VPPRLATPPPGTDEALQQALRESQQQHAALERLQDPGEDDAAALRQALDESQKDDRLLRVARARE
jgi:hypothetical protein